MKRWNYLRNLRSIQLLQTSTNTRRTHFIRHTLHCTHKYCDQKFGFVANPTYTHRSNKAIIVQNTPHLPQPLQTHSPPTNNIQLLGLGHKFIPQRSLPTQNLYSTFTEFARNVCLKYTFSDNNHNTNEFNKNDRKIYIKLPWSLDHGNNELEYQLTKFYNHLQHLTSNNLQSIQKTTNLTRPQTETLSRLKNNQDTITILTDKNLGPAVMYWQEYINGVFTDHLLDTTTYCCLSKQEADQKLAEIHEYLLYTFKNPLSSVQIPYLTKTSKFFQEPYMNPKIKHRHFMA